MVFPFHKIAHFAHTKPREIERALHEFFPSEEAFSMITEDIEAYFTEWLLFEYKQSNNVTFLTEYVLKNPDTLSEKEIDTFRQIAETQWYSDFQIMSMVPGSHVVVEDIFTGKVIDVHDKLGSEHLDSCGSIKARAARVDGVYYFVGANPAFMPMTYTARMKKMLRSCEKAKLSVKDTAMILLEHEMNPPVKIKPLTKAKRKEKQQDIHKKYQELAANQPRMMAWEDVLKHIYNEHGKSVPDFFKNLIKEGIPENVFMDHIDLFQDIWNFFPHKELGDTSPDELFAELKKEK